MNRIVELAVPLPALALANCVTAALEGVRWMEESQGGANG